MFETIVTSVLVFALAVFHIEGTENLINNEVEIEGVEKPGCVVNSSRSYANIEVEGVVENFPKSKIKMTGRACVPNINKG